jgi:hypothetical protein
LDEASPDDDVLSRLRMPFVRRASLEHGALREERFIVDLGLRGVFVEREQPLPGGARVEVTFHLPGNAIPVRATCRVAWWHAAGEPLVSRSLPAGVGLEFVELSDWDRRRIRELVRARLRPGAGRRFQRHWPETAELAELPGDELEPREGEP